jgi:hypothetical protein
VPAAIPPARSSDDGAALAGHAAGGPPRSATQTNS